MAIVLDITAAHLRGPTPGKTIRREDFGYSPSQYDKFKMLGFLRMGHPQSMQISIAKGNILDFSVEAIVNAANEHLLAGSGICGTIHKAAGSELEEACKLLAPCPAGSAVITSGFDLKAKYVIHAVGARWWDGSRNEAALLASTYDSIYRLVAENHIKSIAIPAISTGIYRFPLRLATEIAIARTYANAHLLDGVGLVFACFDEQTLSVYEASVGS